MNEGVQGGAYDEWGNEDVQEGPYDEWVNGDVQEGPYDEWVNGDVQEGPYDEWVNEETLVIVRVIVQNSSECSSLWCCCWKSCTFWRCVLWSSYRGPPSPYRLGR